MLENAEAYIILPRERDLSTTEITIDFDDGIDQSLLYGAKRVWSKTGNKNSSVVFERTANATPYIGIGQQIIGIDK